MACSERSDVRINLQRSVILLGGPKEEAGIIVGSTNIVISGEGVKACQSNHSRS